ncbi:ABC transporter ATP-binding protein [Thermotoga sp.]|uniref:ABC transporter ATP-binding protein n=1 Tax=Thermotoga sp. TaxID=28240 RepID=UPI0025DA36BD|nr:ABC transporter ATP-binding protein [Thermotoga sp.]MCD6551185.1 ABC transporter ATP-binding protein [Thermotoga sp.]
MPVIEAENLTKYYGKNRGIERVTFSVEEGEIFGFIGPNGAGKTTTIRLLLGLIFPTDGRVRIFGKDVFKEGKNLKRSIGYIPGEVNFYPEVTVEELLEYSSRFYRDVDKGYAKKLCKILNLDVKKRIKELSMGNKKKVAIVQVLMHKPKLLVLDEPTNGLDPLVQNIFFEILREEKKRGTTIFFSSHILSEVERLCDRVAMIKEGRIIKIESVENLKKEKYKIVRLRGKSFSILKDLPEVRNLNEENGSIEFLYFGTTGKLLQILNEVKPEDLWISDPSLEEVFISYYREGEK